MRNKMTKRLVLSRDTLARITGGSSNVSLLTGTSGSDTSPATACGAVCISGNLTLERTKLCVTG